MSPPTVPDHEVPVPVPSIDAVRTMLAECDGTDFNDRRDTAIIRLFADTGIRFGEMAPLELDFLDLNESTVLASGRDDGRALCHLVTRLALYGGAICAYGRDTGRKTRIQYFGLATAVR